MDIKENDVIVTLATGQIDDDGDVHIQGSRSYIANIHTNNILTHIPADPARDVPVTADWQPGDVMLVRVSRVDSDGDPNYQRHGCGTGHIPRNSPAIIGRIPAPAIAEPEPEPAPDSLDWARPMLVLLPDGTTERPTEIGKPDVDGNRRIHYPRKPSGRYFRADGRFLGDAAPDRIIYAPTDDAPTAPQPIDWDKPLLVVECGDEYPGVYVGKDPHGHHVVAWIDEDGFSSIRCFEEGGSAADDDDDYRVFNAPE